MEFVQSAKKMVASALIVVVAVMSSVASAGMLDNVPVVGDVLGKK